MCSEPDSKDNNNKINKMLIVKTTIKKETLRNKLPIITDKHNSSNSGLISLMVKAGININYNILTNWRETHKNQLSTLLLGSTTLSSMMNECYTI